MWCVLVCVCVWMGRWYLCMRVCLCVCDNTVLTNIISGKLVMNNFYGISW